MNDPPFYIGGIARDHCDVVHKLSLICFVYVSRQYTKEWRHVIAFCLEQFGQHHNTGTHFSTDKKQVKVKFILTSFKIYIY